MTEATSLKGAIRAPPSKSYTHRAIILAGLSAGRTTIESPLLAADPLVTIEVMRAAGADIQIDGNDLKVIGNDGNVVVPSKPVNLSGSGTTMGVMPSIFSLCDKRVELIGGESMKKKRLGQLLEALEGAGVITSSNAGSPPITVQGPIKGGELILNGDVNSQFISGLLMACPLRGSATTIKGLMTIKEQPYLDVTLDAISSFGGIVHKRGSMEFEIPGRQTYSCDKYVVEGSFAASSFILGASAITDDKITVTNLPEDSLQGDKFFIDLLKMMGANVRTRDGEVSVSGAKSLRAIDIDLSQAPDLLPVLAVMCSLAHGRSRLYNVEQLRFKSQDRISGIAQGLKRMGAKIEEKQDGLVIDGCDGLVGSTINSFGDHKLVMAFTVAAQRASGKTRITHAESVKSSYPNFIEDMKKLGANINLVPS